MLSRGDVQLRLPATTAALRVLYQILILEDFDDGKIGRPSFPTQAQLDEMVKDYQKRLKANLTFNIDDTELDL